MISEKFQLDTGAPYLRNAYYLGLAAKAAYRDDPGGAYPGLADVLPRMVCFERERTFGFVAGNETDVVAAFRGTNENRFWVEGLSYGQVDAPPGRVHEGLARAAGSVRRELLAALFDVGAVEKRVWLTGHSLGGAVAMLLARDLFAQGFEPVLLCTYGSPRVLDPDAAAAFETPTYRFVNTEDPVPDFPWPTLFGTYAHAGRLVYLLPSGQVAEVRHAPHLARRIDRAMTLGDPPAHGAWFEEHRLASYLAKLRRYA